VDDRDLGEVLLPKLVRLDDEPVDPNDLAAYVEGSLPADQHAQLATRIERNPEAMMLVRAMEEDQRHARSVRWRALALAASVLLGLGLWWTQGRSRDAREEALDVRLLAAVINLGEQAPETFEGFAPIPDEELRTSASVTRGGAAWTAPTGILLEAPKTLRWRMPDGSSRVRVSLRGPGVDWSQEVDGDQVAAPTLGPGRYVARLEMLDALGAQTTRAVFEIADAEDRARLARAEDAIRANAEGALADLLLAHYATWAGFHGAAHAAAERAATAGGETGAAAAKLVRHLDVIAPR
jgi:hypothetical protein